MRRQCRQYGEGAARIAEIRDIAKHWTDLFHEQRPSGEFLRRYVVAAKIGQKVAPPQVMKACPAMARKAVVTAGANPKAASADNMKKACAAGKGRPVIATAGFLSSMTAGVRCMDRTMKSFRALQIDPKVGSQKNAQTACKNARNRPAIAVRNFLARLTKNAK